MGWLLRLWESRDTFQRRFSCSSSHRYLIFCLAVHSCLDWWLALGTEFHGECPSCLRVWKACIKTASSPDPTTSLLMPSTADFPRPPSRLTTMVLKLFSMLRLTRLTTHPTTGQILSATNLTILNCLLIHTGPMSERALVLLMMSVQVSCYFFMGNPFKS